MEIDGIEIPDGLKIDADDEQIVERLKGCIGHPLAGSFKTALEALSRMTKGRPGTYVDLRPDFAPLSWTFAVVVPGGSVALFGGLIFHGSHDGYGTGGAPTFSVSLSGDAGWQLHT